MLLTRIYADRILSSCCRGFLHYVPYYSPRGSRGGINQTVEESPPTSVDADNVSQNDNKFDDYNSEGTSPRENLKDNRQRNKSKQEKSRQRDQVFESRMDGELPPNVEFPSDVDGYYSSKYKSPNDWARDQSKHAYRPKINPKETSVLLFPGQGSQFVGMGKRLLDFPNVADLYEVASNILGYDLLDVCLNGPKEKLNKTIYCQPAVVVTSLAAVESLKQDMPWAIENCVSAAGYSVGEYSALVFAGSISFEDAIRVVKVRAEAMQAASEEVSSGMMTVLLHADAKVNFACHAARLYCTRELKMENAVCEVSNFLFPGCKVLAGHTEALRFIETNAKEFGIRRVQYLPVSGAFHTRLMLPARQALVKALSSITIAPTIVPVHSNVNSYKYGASKNISQLLSQQIHKPVRWEQIVHVLYSRPMGEDFPMTFEVGPGQQLGAMLRKVNMKAYSQYTAVDV